jgi:hypothetical protein
MEAIVATGVVPDQADRRDPLDNARNMNDPSRDRKTVHIGKEQISRY